MNTKYYKLAGNLLFLIVTIGFVYWEGRDLISTKIIYGSDELVMFYLRCLFLFFAMPLMWLARIMIMVDLLHEDSHHYYQIKVFNYSVYALLVVYGLALFLDRWL